MTNNVALIFMIKDSILIIDQGMVCIVLRDQYKFRYKFVFDVS